MKSFWICSIHIKILISTNFANNHIVKSKLYYQRKKYSIRYYFKSNKILMSRLIQYPTIIQYSKFHNSIKILDKQQYHLVLVHVHIALHVIVPAYIVPLCIAQVCLPYVKQQVEYLLLLVKEIHISGMPSGVGGVLRAANGSERHQQNYLR